MMSPFRLAEFRRKIREGHPVSVVRGRVELADERTQHEGPSRRNRARHPGKPRHDWQGGGRHHRKQRHANRPHKPGVVVQPHHWGAWQFYMSPQGENRAMKEQSLLRKYYPAFRMELDDEGVPYIHGEIGPNDKLRYRYELVVVLPPGFGHGEMPQAYVVKPTLRGDAPHLYADGSLCLDESGAFTDTSSVVTFLGWVSVWLILYEGWLTTGERW